MANPEDAWANLVHGKIEPLPAAPAAIVVIPCPDCGQYIREGTIAHQHANGEWIHTDDLRRFWQIRRWEKILKEKGE
jgi:hypothetical protein